MLRGVGRGYGGMPRRAAGARAEATRGATPEEVRLMDRVALEALTPDHRAVIELTYFQGRSCREIAEIMGCPVATVKTRMFYARQKLKGLLGRREEAL